MSQPAEFGLYLDGTAEECILRVWGSDITGDHEPDAVVIEGLTLQDILPLFLETCRKAADTMKSRQNIHV